MERQSCGDDEHREESDAGSACVPGGLDPLGSLVGRVRAGDREAAAEFVERYWPRVRRRIRRRLGRQMRRLYDSDDIFSTVNRRFDQMVDAQKVRAVSEQELMSLVQRIVNGAVADKARDFARLTRAERADSEYVLWLQTRRRAAPPPEHGEIQRLAGLLDNARDRQVLEMRLAGSRFKAISRATGLNPRAARKRWQLIREKLRQAGYGGPSIGEDRPD